MNTTRAVTTATSHSRGSASGLQPPHLPERFGATPGTVHGAEQLLAEARAARVAHRTIADYLRFAVVAGELLGGGGHPRSARQRPPLRVQGGVTMSAAAPAAIPVMLRVEDRIAFSTLACPQTGQPLQRVGDALVTPDRAHSYPIVREIPRFV